MVLYIGSDGKKRISSGKTGHVKIELVQVIKTDEVRHSSGNDKVELSCKRNPQTFTVHHDMSKPFFKTKKVRISFSDHEIAIAAVALRYSLSMDPVEVIGCKPMQYYNPTTQSCNTYECKRPSCKSFKIKNANAIVKCTGHYDGDTCHVQCKKGFLPDKKFKVTCVYGKWSRPPTRCVPVDCKMPTMKHAVFGR